MNVTTSVAFTSATSAVTNSVTVEFCLTVTSVVLVSPDTEISPIAISPSAPATVAVEVAFTVTFTVFPPVTLISAAVKSSVSASPPVEERF